MQGRGMVCYGALLSHLGGTRRGRLGSCMLAAASPPSLLLSGEPTPGWGGTPGCSGCCGDAAAAAWQAVRLLHRIGAGCAQHAVLQGLCGKASASSSCRCWVAASMLGCCCCCCNCWGFIRRSASGSLMVVGQNGGISQQQQQQQNPNPTKPPGYAAAVTIPTKFAVFSALPDDCPGAWCDENCK